MASANKCIIVTARSFPAIRPVSQQYLASIFELSGEIDAHNGGSR
jgi:hypothetical protein